MTILGKSGFLDPDNLYISPRDFVVAPEVWANKTPGQAVWFEFEKLDERGRLRSERPLRTEFCLRESARNDRRLGIPVHCKRVGFFMRALRLWRGPVKKLDDWKQMPVGHSLMLSPVECEKEEDLAIFRKGYLANRGFGRFDVNTRDDGSLWVTRL